MNRQTLKAILDREGIKPGSYELGGGLPAECYTIDREGDAGWCVYYSERGARSGKRSFGTEAEACEYLLKLLREDRTTRTAPTEQF